MTVITTTTSDDSEHENGDYSRKCGQGLFLSPHYATRMQA